MTSGGRSRTRVVLWVAFAGFVVLMVVGSMGVAWWWGAGFDEAEALGAATPATDTAMVANVWVAVVGLTGSLVTGPTAVIYERRHS